MKQIKVVILLLILIIYVFDANGCTIVAVSGRATDDGRPLLFKNRDSSTWNIKLNIGHGSGYVYFSQCVVNDGDAFSGYNETGFSIVSSHSYNMPNSNYWWNAYIMQLALENCASVDEFENLLDTLSKPIPVCANYGVIDAQGNVSIFEVAANTYVKFDANSNANGYLIRTNFSFSQDTTIVNSVAPSSYPRYQIASNFLEGAVLANGYITKEDLFSLSRCLVNSDGEDLLDSAPFDENTYTPVDFRFYIPKYSSTSAMVIQGVLTDEGPNLTVAWTKLGSPMTSICVPYWITPRYVLPQKAKIGADGHSWFCYRGQQLKNNCFVDSNTLDLAKLYNMCGTGVMQKICNIEEAILDRGNVLMDKLRNGEAHCNDVESYFAWVDDYVEEQYEQNNLLEMNSNESIDETIVEEGEIEYYDVLGRRVRNVKEGAIIKRSGKIAIVFN